MITTTDYDFQVLPPVAQSPNLSDEDDEEKDLDLDEVEEAKDTPEEEDSDIES